MYDRFIQDRVDEALADTPVVLLAGPRRSGKTTLARARGNAGRPYFTLDDQTILEAAVADPPAFLRGIGFAVIDEIQRVPELLLAIKKTVDEDTRPGRFLLTGSANVMTLPRVTDSLAGRIQTLMLLPLSRAETLARRPSFLDDLFDGRMSQPRNRRSVRRSSIWCWSGHFPRLCHAQAPTADRHGEDRT